MRFIEEDAIMDVIIDIIIDMIIAVIEANFTRGITIINKCSFRN